MTESEKKIETSPDPMNPMSEERCFFWARQGRKRRLEEKIEHERKNYDRLAIYGNILDD